METQGPAWHRHGLVFCRTTDETFDPRVSKQLHNPGSNLEENKDNKTDPQPEKAVEDVEQCSKIYVLKAVKPTRERAESCKTLKVLHGGDKQMSSRPQGAGPVTRTGILRELKN